MVKICDWTTEEDQIAVQNRRKIIVANNEKHFLVIVMRRKRFDGVKLNNCWRYYFFDELLSKCCIFKQTTTTTITILLKRSPLYYWLWYIQKQTIWIQATFWDYMCIASVKGRNHVVDFEGWTEKTSELKISRQFSQNKITHNPMGQLPL